MFRPGLETEVGVAVGKAVPYRHVEVCVVEQQLKRMYTVKEEEVKKTSETINASTKSERGTSSVIEILRL